MPEAVIVNPFMHPDVIVHLRDDQHIVEDRVTVGHAHDMRLGAGAYTAKTLLEHGWSVEIVDAIGDDIFGDYTFRASVEAGFGMDHVVRYRGSHMFLLSVADRKSRGGTMISSCPPDWQRPAAEIESSILAAPSASVYYIWSWFWSYANANLQELSATGLVKAIRQKATLVALDPNWKPPDNPPAHEVDDLLAALPDIDILKLNRRDAAVIIGEKDSETTVRELHDRGASLVVLTLGEDGCALGGRDVSGVVFIPSAASQPVNTTGAGDAFGGALVADFALHGDPLRAAHSATEHVSRFLRGTP
jgi:sugar/nucleoside kinase (ribokinase family)